jgi:5-methylcytosine-specific restriction endonuclease McrA
VSGALQLDVGQPFGPGPGIRFSSLHHDGRCRCGAKRNTLTLDVVIPWEGYEADDAAGINRLLSRQTSCVNAVACRARREKQADRARTRRGALFFDKPAAPDARPPYCRWCGDEIVLADPADYRRRQRNYHRGDEHEEGDRDCLHLWRASVTWDARVAVRRLAERAGRDALACVDCGVVVEERDEQNGWVCTRWRDFDERDPETGYLGEHVAIGPPWEADHEVPLEDGGEHSLDNLRCRCVPCHRDKTAREGAARAMRRRRGALLPSGAQGP